jgi:large subunit ribosomal protein L4
MPVADVVNLEGKTVGQVTLADDVFGAEVNPHVLHETVRHYLNSQRAGTHKTKDKSEVSGAGRKLWKQKGTGRARIGSIRSPLWRHGGTVHGPRPRKYTYRLPRRVILGALRSALSAKFAQSKLTVVEGWELESHKTKPFRQTLTKLDGGSRTVLLVDSAENANLDRASRNLVGVKLVLSAQVHAYDVLRHDRLMLSRSAAEKLGRALGAATATTEAEPKPASVQIAPAPKAAKAAPKAKAAKKAAPKAAPKKARKPKAKE